MLMEDTFNNFHSPELIFFLKNLDAEALPGLKAHLELTPYRAVKGGFEQAPDHARKGSVAVVLGIHEQKAVIVLTKRVDYKGVHGGQISFPGGKHEPGDADLLQTAQRETMEEIGLELNPEMLVRPLTAIYIPPSNFLVQPYLFATEKILDW